MLFDWVTKDDLRDFATKNDLSKVEVRLDKVELKLEKLEDKVEENKTVIAEIGWRISSLERVQYAVLVAILAGLAEMFFFPST